MKVPDMEHTALVMLTRLRGSRGIFFFEAASEAKSGAATPCNMHGLFPKQQLSQPQSLGPHLKLMLYS